jgi:hypothetical protein
MTFGRPDRLEGMGTQQMRQLRALEGRRVGVALKGGSRLDGCQLVSGPRGPSRTVWLFADGEDRFVRCSDVVDLWEDR